VCSHWCVCVRLCVRPGPLSHVPFPLGTWRRYLRYPARPSLPPNDWVLVPISSFFFSSSPVISPSLLNALSRHPLPPLLPSGVNETRQRHDNGTVRSGEATNIRRHDTEAPEVAIISPAVHSSASLGQPPPQPNSTRPSPAAPPRHTTSRPSQPAFARRRSGHIPKAQQDPTQAQLRFRSSG
jgi:hypothetical protein